MEKFSALESLWETDLYFRINDDFKTIEFGIGFPRASVESVAD